MRRALPEQARFTVDTPVPYRVSDLTGLIDERMGKLENKKDLSPYRQLRTRIDSISQDGRYAFMFGSLTVYDGMTQILSRIFRVPVNNKPITIVELTGLPTEIINVVVSVLARMTFDFAHWSEGKVPLTLVCEEAHRYVPASDHLGFEPCKRAIAKIAKEGRKYDRDQEIVNSAITDTGSGLLEFLPSLGQREALAFGDGVALPVRIKFDELPANCLPRSTTARFTEHWQRSVGDEGFLEHIVEKWRTSDIGAGGDLGQHPAFLGDPFNPEAAATPPPAAVETRRPEPQAAPRREPDLTRPVQPTSPPGTGYGSPRPSNMQPARPPATLRKDAGQPPAPSETAVEEKDVPGSSSASRRGQRGPVVRSSAGRRPVEAHSRARWPALRGWPRASVRSAASLSEWSPDRRGRRPSASRTGK